MRELWWSAENWTLRSVQRRELQSHLQETEWFPGRQALTVTWLNVLTHLREACVNQKWHCSATMQKEKRVTKAVTIQSRQSLGQQMWNIMVSLVLVMKVSNVTVLFQVFLSHWLDHLSWGDRHNQFILVGCHCILEIFTSFVFLTYSPCVYMFSMCIHMCIHILHVYISE